MLKPVSKKTVAKLRGALGGDLVLFKIGRWDPAKRWLMAVEATARLKNLGIRVVFPVRGGIEAHGGQVMNHAYTTGLRIAHVNGGPLSNWQECVNRIEKAGPADLLNLSFAIPQSLLPIFYAATDVVLANSGHEPFGLVGLEAMASGGVVFTGCSGEDYAVSMKNAMVLETDDPEELVEGILYLQAHPQEKERLRQEAKRTARQFTWPMIVTNLINKATYLAHKQNALPAIQSGMFPAPAVAE
jgi:glycosyltransferase involved in cell wall biosynthesis